MKETIVYLPVSRNASDMPPDALVFNADEIADTLNSAGVKWAQESPEELKIRMLKLQIEELKRAYLELQDQHLELRNVYTPLQDENAALKITASSLQSQLKAARDCNLTLETKLRRFEDLEEKHAELRDKNIELRNVCTTLENQNEALKTISRMAQEELKAVHGEYKA